MIFKFSSGSNICRIQSVEVSRTPETERKKKSIWPEKLGRGSLEAIYYSFI